MCLAQLQKDYVPDTVGIKSPTFGFLGPKWTTETIITIIHVHVHESVKFKIFI